MNIKDAIQGILTKSLTTEQAFEALAPGDREEFTATLSYILKKTASIPLVELVKTNTHGQWSLTKAVEPLSKPPVSEAQRRAMWAAASGHSTLDIPKKVGKEFAEADEGGKLPEKKKKKEKMEKEEKEYKQVKVQMDSDTYDKPGKHNPDMASPVQYTKTNPKAPLHKNNEQWSLSKAIKQGPTLHYGEMNPKPNYAEIEANAPTIDYQKDRMAMPKRYAGAKEKAMAVRENIEREANEPALDTIRRKQKMKKAEGTNQIANPSSGGKYMGVDKNEMMGYGGGQSMANGSTLTQGEKDEGSPEHEMAEKKKAKKIKDEAEDILDMHKREDCKY